MKRECIIGIIVSIVILILFLNARRQKFSNDPEIKELQKEAIELRVYEKVKEIRSNAISLFGFKWNYGGTIDFTENDVTFRGYDGYYEIEYKNILIKWKDLNYLRVYYEDSGVVYEASMRNSWFQPTNIFGEVVSFHRGEWIKEFNEMYQQAMKGIPGESEEDEKERRWGISD